MGFGEANQNKKVILVEFGPAKPKITEIKVPCFQQLVRITGSLDEIQTKIAQLKREESQAWLEIEYSGTELRGNLRDLLEESVLGSQLEITIIKNKRTNDLVLKTINENETLEELDINEVFIRCLDEAEVPEEGRQELTASYHEIVRSLQEEDLQAE
jgi:exonuclease SbcD